MTIIKGIEKAILTSDIGINPQNDGTAIRLIFPPMTEERRRDLTKEISRLAEECKVAIRSIRRDAMDKFKDMKKKSEITEDDLKDAEKEIQKITDNFTKEIETICDAKQKEVMSIWLLNYRGCFVQPLLSILYLKVDFNRRWNNGKEISQMWFTILIFCDIL